MRKIIKVIDLLNTPLDKLPKKIKIEDTIYNLLIDEDNLIYYQNEECKYFMYSISCFNELNEEVEIIEENPDIKCSEYTIGDSSKVNGFTFTRCDGGLMVIPPEQEEVIEDKEIRPLPPYKYEDEVLKIDLSRKIDELIKAVNELKKGK